MYTEEKFEDEEDMRQRTKALVESHNDSRHGRPLSDSDVELEDLVRLAKQHGELYPMMLEILSYFSQILSKDTAMYVIHCFRADCVVDLAGAQAAESGPILYLRQFRSTGGFA